MDKICLIIDDKDQQHAFNAQIRDVLNKKGYNVDAVFINTTNPDVLNDEQNIDIGKLSNYISDSIKDKHIDVVATDFDLSDDAVNGLNIVEIVRNVCNRKRTPIVLYSGNLEKVIKSVIGDPIKDSSALTADVKTLMLYHIHDFIDRTGYAESVNKILQEKETSTKQILLKKLREYPDMKFMSCYPAFTGKTLGNIADEIEKSTYHGQGFQSELIEQTVAYLIDINGDKE
jgi:hypothetical protein